MPTTGFIFDEANKVAVLADGWTLALTNQARASYDGDSLYNEALLQLNASRIQLTGAGPDAPQFRADVADLGGAVLVQMLSKLPTTNPHAAGVPWLDGEALKVSLG